MEEIIHALGGLMLRAIPTICLLLFLFFYLRAMLFSPLDKILKQRDELTAGARKAAEASLAAAESKQKEYEQKFMEARNDVYRAQEETRRKWLAEQAAQAAETRKRMEETVRNAKGQIAAEAEGAKASLESTSSDLADEIASSVLSRKGGSR